MRYMLLINSDESRYETMTEADGAKLMADYGTFTSDLQKAGALVGSDRLQPSATATTSCSRITAYWETSPA